MAYRHAIGSGAQLYHLVSGMARRMNRPVPNRVATLVILLALSCCTRSNGLRIGVSGTASRADASAPCATAPRRDAATIGASGTFRLAVIGDYGSAGPNERDVAALVKGWSSDAVITTGDNNYPRGAAETIDANIGQYYHDFIGGYAGQYGCGCTENRFFPSLGNHDLYTDHGAPYRAYFSLPGNERYYDVVLGSVHLFALDSDPSEPDGVTSNGAQATWLKARLAASTSAWKVVFMHHPPHSSGPHQSSIEMRWPFKKWGANLVLAGHDHDYERLTIDGLTYIVNGLGGASLYVMGAPIAGSLARFDADFGAVLVDAQPNSLTARFFTARGQMVDRVDLNRAP